VGYDGANDLKEMARDLAVKSYNKKYKEKISKGYNDVKMALGKVEPTIIKEDNKEDDDEEEKDGVKPKSKLSEGVLDLIKFIFDMKLIEKSVISVGYDI
jgi:hypothetical protein